MTTPTDSDPLGALRAAPVGPLAPGKAGAPAGAQDATGVRFRALLERLEERARDLDERSRTLDGAAELASVVGAARASLEDALTLGDELLEAFREARLQGGLDPTPEKRP